MRNILVSDITLKQQRQLSFRDKTQIVRCLNKIGVDSIEFPEILHEKEETIVNKTLSNIITNSMIKINSGLSEKSIDIAWESICESQNPCLQICVPVSPVQMEYVCHKKAPQISEMVINLCSYAKSKCKNVELVAIDASRAEKQFLTELCVSACNHGVTSIVLNDDAGILMPDDYENFIKSIRDVCKVKIFIQPSDSLYMAAANSLCAIRNGADGIITCLTNEAFLSEEKLAQIIRVKGEDENISSNLDITAVHDNSIEIFNIINNTKSPINIKTQSTATKEINLNSQSSMSDVYIAIKELGYQLSTEDNAKVYEAFERVVKKKGSVGSKELDAMIATGSLQVPSTYHLESYVINSGNIITATANIILVKNNEKHVGISTGDGPIDASFLAIEQIIGHHYDLDDFQIQSITEGREAVGSAIVKLRSNGILYSGQGISTDIVGASIRAYLNAVNKIIYEEV